jgi:hypothetical protein
MLALDNPSPIRVVLYVFEIPKIAGGKVVGISKTHH